MATQTNKHGVTKPVQPKAGRWAVVKVKAHARTRPLSETVAKKKAKHRVAMEKLARG